MEKRCDEKQTGEISPDDEMQLPTLKCENCNRMVTKTWKCIDCKKILCYNCKFLHLRGKTTRKHQFVETKAPKVKFKPKITKFMPRTFHRSPKVTNTSDSYTEDKGMPETEETCRDHKKNLYLHCKKCDEPICGECVNEGHKNHDTVILQLYAKTEKLQIMQKIGEFKRTRLQELKAMLHTNAKKRELSQKGLTSSLEELKEQVAALLDEVQSVGNEIAEDLKNLHIENEFLIKRCQQEAENSITGVNEAIEFCESNLESSVYNIYHVKEKMSWINVIGKLPVEPRLTLPKFTKGLISRSLIDKLLSSGITLTEEEEIQEETQEVKIELPVVRPDRPKTTQTMKSVQSYVPDELDRFNLCQSGVSSISVGPDQSLSVRDSRTTRGIQKIFVKGRKLDIREPVEFDKVVSDICCYDFKSTLVTFVGSTAIKIVSNQGKISTFTDLTPLFPVSVSRSSSGSVIVSVVESDELEADDDSTRAIYIISAKGRVLNKIERFKGERILNRPYRVLENNKGHLVAIDFIDIDDRVVWLKKDGEEICSYRGHASPKYPRLMAAQGLACDKMNNVYVSDARNNVIHIVDGAGKFVRYIENDMVRFYSPWALCVDNEKLWIGTSNGRLYLTLIG